MKKNAVAIMNWNSEAGNAQKGYLLKEFNPLLMSADGVDIYVYDGDAAKNSGLMITEEEAVTRFGLKTKLEQELRDMVFEFATEKQKTEMEELEEGLRELYAEWNAEGNVGVKPNFPEMDRLNDLRNEIIEGNEKLMMFREMVWEEASLHRDTFESFITRMGIPVDGKTKEYLRFLVPMRMKRAIDNMNRSWMLNHNWEDKFTPEEIKTMQREVWGDNRRRKEVNCEASDGFPQYFSQLMDGLKYGAFSLYKKHNLMEYFNEIEDYGLADYARVNKEIVANYTMESDEGDRDVSYEIIPRFYVLYELDIIGKDQLKTLVGEPGNFDEVFDWYDRTVKYRKECIKTGKIDSFRSLFYPLSPWREMTMVFEGEVYNTPIGLAYGQIVRDDKPNSKTLFKSAKDYDGIKVAQVAAGANNAFKKGASLSEGKLNVAALMLEEDEEFRKALLKSGSLEFNTKDVGWNDALTEVRETYFAANKAKIDAYLAELKASSLDEETKMKELVEKYNLSEEQREEVEGRLALQNVLELVKIAEEMATRKFEEE